MTATNLKREDELEIIKFLEWIPEYNLSLTIDWNMVMMLSDYIEDIEEQVSANPQQGGYWPYRVGIHKRKTVIYKDADTFLIAHGNSKIEAAIKAITEFIRQYNYGKRILE